VKVVVLGGAGAMGSGIVRDLLSPKSCEIDEVIVADSSAERERDLKKEFLDRRFQTVRLDVRNKGATLQLLREADVCVNSVPTFLGYQMDIFHLCLDARCPYLDLGGMGVYTEKQKAEHEKWVREGVPAILGFGLAPGLSNILAKAVAERLDVIDRINIFWASKSVGSEQPIFIPPYSTLTLLAEYANPSRQFLDGELREVPAQSGKITLVLPEPFGETEFMHSQHSEPITVPFSKGFRDKGIKEFTWRLSLPRPEHEVLKALVKCGFGDFDEPVNVNGLDVKPGDFIEALIRWNMAKNKGKIQEVEECQILFAIGEGDQGGRKTKVTVTAYMFPHPEYKAYINPVTSMSASIGAQILGAGKVPPGVWAPEECVDTKEFFEEMKKRHLRITESVEVEL